MKGRWVVWSVWECGSCWLDEGMQRGGKAAALETIWLMPGRRAGKQLKLSQSFSVSTSDSLSAANFKARRWIGGSAHLRRRRMQDAVWFAAR
jgi:hypothetical protein